jgi:hypothetical protein
MEAVLFYFLLPFLLVSLTFLTIVLIRPAIINQFFHCKLTRLKLIGIFGTLTAIFAFLIVVITPRTTNEGIAGVSTSEPTKTTIEQTKSSTSDQKIEPEVKKSSTGICHAKGTKYYDITTNYKSFSSLEICLRGGGRLPKN